MAKTREPWSTAARLLDASTTNDFAELIRIAGLDPAKHLQHAYWTGVSFRDCDLRDFDFTGAKLHGCDFAGARLAGPGPLTEIIQSIGAAQGLHEAFGTSQEKKRIPRRRKPLTRFDQAELGQVVHDAETLPLPDGSGRPARYTAPIADLRKASDWKAYCRQWEKPLRPLSDSHLPVGAIFQDAPFGPEMVVVPAGEFWMGSPDGSGGDQGDVAEPERNDIEGPRHRVTIAQPFAVGRFAVTFDEWDMAQGHPLWEKSSGLESRLPNDQNWGRGRQPVINVSWHDATAYCRWLSKVTGHDYRLLSEAEWEYICRAGTKTPFWWGKEISTDQASYNGNHAYGTGKKGKRRQRTEPVDGFEPNPWGLHQVHGNVWEWCADNWHENYRGAPEDGAVWQGGDESFRVVRGGSWGYDPRNLRSANRNRGQPDDRDLDLGFRVSRTLTP